MTKLNSIRKRSPELGFANLHSECKPIENDFECEPVEQHEMEVDDIVIHDNDDDGLKSDDNDLCPIANDLFKSAELKRFDKGMPHMIETGIFISQSTSNALMHFITSFNFRYGY